MAEDASDADTDMLRRVAGARARLQLALPALERERQRWRDAVAGVGAVRGVSAGPGAGKPAARVWLDVGGGSHVLCDAARAKAIAQSTVDDAAAAVEALEAEVRRCRAIIAGAPEWASEVLGSDVAATDPLAW